MLIDMPGNSGMVNINEIVDIGKYDEPGKEMPYLLKLTLKNNRIWTWSFLEEKTRNERLNEFRNNFKALRQNWKDFFRVKL